MYLRECKILVVEFTPRKPSIRQFLVKPKSAKVILTSITVVVFGQNGGLDLRQSLSARVPKLLHCSMRKGELRIYYPQPPGYQSPNGVFSAKFLKAGTLCIVPFLNACMNK